MAFNENTRMTPEWIRRVWTDNPCVRLDNGNIRFLARTAFCNVLERPKHQPGDDPNKEKAYGAVLLIPDLSLIGGEAALEPLTSAKMALLKEHYPAALNNQDILDKLHNPFKKQGGYINKKSEAGDLFEGFVPGRLCISANSSQSKPPVVDQNGAPIVEKSQVYSGCWVLAAVRPEWIKNPKNPGPTFYLQSLMVVAGDNSLGGVGQSDPRQDFAGVKVDPAVNPAGAFGVDPSTSGRAAAPALSAADMLS